VSAPTSAGPHATPASAMFADLHLHTCFSDGTFTPEELVRTAAERGLSAIALSDHDTMAGCPRARAASIEHGLDFIPACELTVDHEGRELHVLGYGLDPEQPALAAFLACCREARHDRIREMARRLLERGVDIPADSVEALAHLESPGRPHIGQALVDSGHCTSLDEAFERFLKKGRPGWAPKWRIASAEAMTLIHRAGGLAVLAHPGLYRLDDAIPSLCEAGLDGLECYHSKHSPSAAIYYRELADRHQLLVTGGSDCHGFTKGAPLIGGVKLEWNLFDIFRQRLLPSAATPAITPHPN